MSTKKSKLRVIFFGTPEYAVPSLEALYANFDVVAVVSQPDRPSGRGNQVVATPVKAAAESLGIKVLQPPKIREAMEDLAQIPCDVMVTVAYGQIIPKQILDIARLGVINAHGSLLPKYRGSSPVQWALIKGEDTTGVTIMQTDTGLDSGHIWALFPISIDDSDTQQSLMLKLSKLSASALVETLPKIDSGEIASQPQEEGEATYFPLLRKTDGEIDFCDTAKSIVDKIRGLTPWPGAYTYLDDVVVKVWAASVTGGVIGATGGEVIASNPADGLVVASGDAKGVYISELQLAGGKRMDIKDFLRGRVIPIGTVFGRQF